MKKNPVILFLLLVFASVLISCKKEFEKLQVQIDDVVSTEINPIKKQIEEINGSIKDLEQTDKELKGYIETLEGTARQLQADITANDTKIDQTATAIRHELTVAQTSLEGNIALAKTEVVGQLTALRTEMQGKLDAVNATISELKAKDTALETQIANLRTYVDTQLALQTANTKEWANSTFSTLAQYQATTTEIEAIKSSITTLNASLTDLETRLNTKIAADIATAVSTLEGELATTVTEITTAYTNAISTAKSEITSAYTTAIANAISASEISMKTWVNEQLTGYYTIAKAETKLDSLHAVLNGQLTSQQEYLTVMIGSLEEQLTARIGEDEKKLDTLKTTKTQLESALAATNEVVAANTKSIDSLRVNLAKAKAELTEAYTSAINTAITTLDGKLTGDIATAVTNINTRIDQEVAALDAKITTLTSRVAACEAAITAIQTAIQTMLSDINNLKAQVEALIKQIQSVVVIPNYSDGSVACSSGNTTFQFKVLPSGTAAQLAQAPLSAFKMEAVYTKTKALPTFVNIPVTSVSSIGDILKVTANVTDLKSEFFSGTQSANASLTINSGVSSCSTEYFPLYYDSSLEPVIPRVDLSATETANCYVVSSVGAYKFKGNVKGNSSTSLDGTPVKAELLWETFGTNVEPNVNDIVASVSYKDGYVEFDTPATLKDGNALIAVKDADENILWSWHIWVCKDFDPVATEQEYYNDAGTMMDRNLGATSATPGEAGVIGLMYQWGRKDPFLNSNHSSTISWPAALRSDSEIGTIDYSISHPTTFIGANTNTDPEYQDWYYPRNNLIDSTRWQSNKTIYDPCPAGWRVPDGGADGVWAKAAGVNTDFSYEYDSSNRGMNFSGKFGDANIIWYPQPGFLMYNDGAAKTFFFMGNGFWWSCTPNYSVSTYYFYYIWNGGTGHVIPSATHYLHSYGLSVRCQKDVPKSAPVVTRTDLSATETANCYVVSTGGAYKFKGNVKGNTNTALDGTPVKAELLWETFGTDVTPNINDVIASVSYKDGYVEFETPETLKNGNAVIAVKDATDNILWSWHIWVCKDFDPVATGQEYYNDAGTMMDRNLGATSATPGDVGALGLLYQWGRKDPFLGSSSISSNAKAKSTLSTWPSPVSSDSSNGTVAYAVAHPTTVIYGVKGTSYDWVYSSRDDKLWQSAKTIYDPCPPGWKVPAGGSSGVWSEAANTSSWFSYTWNSTNRGMNFSGKFGSASTIWYPAAGYLYCDDGSLLNVGYYGYWWSCTPSDNFAYLLRLNSDGGVSPSVSNYRAYGLSVRCLKE